MVTGSLEAIAGDSLSYRLGRNLGLDWLRRHWRRLGMGAARLQKVEGHFQRHGGKSVFFSHFMHLLRALVPFTAGAMRLPYRRFLTYDALGCILWASVFAWLGYFFGQNWKLLEKWIGRAGAVVGVLLIFAIFWVLVIRPQQRRVKDHQAAISAIKKGDEVVTGGGIRGRVTKVDDTEAEVEIANGVRVRVIKSTLSAVLTPSAKPAND